MLSNSSSVPKSESRPQNGRSYNILGSHIRVGVGGVAPLQGEVANEHEDALMIAITSYTPP